MQAIKIRHGNQVRRDSLEGEITLQIIHNTFSELFGRPLEGETLRYKDDESEWVDISTDRELREALRITQGKTLELQVHKEEGRHCGRFGGRWRRDIGEAPRREGPPHRHGHFPPHPFFPFAFGPHGHPHVHPHAHPHPPPHFSFPTQEEGFRHPAKCDNCNVQIVGVRHKCDACPDYDLCASCIGNANKIHPEHAFTPLERSFPRWHHCHAERVLPQEKAEEEQVVDATVLVEDEIKQEETTKEEEPSAEVQEEIVEAQEEPAEEAQESVEEQAEEVQNDSERSGLARVEILQKLQQLESMGFVDDKQRNIRLILAYNGDMSMIMDELLNEL